MVFEGSLEQVEPVARHRTALVRDDLSRPLRTAIADRILSSDLAVMDFGCGRGDDVRFLQERGFDCAGWDPVHAPQGVRREADVVNLGYVVNVIEEPLERQQVLREAWSLARRTLIVSARLSADIQGPATTPYADGRLTRLRTFQKFYEQQELRTWIDQTLDAVSVAAAPGIFYVFRDMVERANFVASRFRRVTTVPRLKEGERLYTENKVLLDRLASFISDRGRLPAEEEFAEYSDIEMAFGSMGRAYRILEKISEPDAWQAVRESRSQDLLAFLALARFDGRPKACELARDMQLDVKSFFGSYSAACAAADKLLFSLGQPEKLEEACRAAPIGKLMPTALYVHTDAISELPILLRLYEGCARRYLGSVPGANLVKLGRNDRKVSYLSYPQFEDDPHPALTASTSVDLQTFRVRQRHYADHRNPPVLHRKESFVGAGHSDRAKFARLTRIEESKGLFEEPSSIGTRLGWLEALSKKSLTLRGHRLVSAQPRARSREDWSEATRGFYEQCGSEYFWRGRNAPMAQALSAFAARLPPNGRVADLGCGAGYDLGLFLQRGLEPIGLDYSRALSLAAARHSGAPVVTGDIRSLPFGSDFFDGAWAAASMLHLHREEMAGALAEIHRVLLPEGLFFASLKVGWGEEPDRLGRWFSYFQPAEWSSRLADAHFEVLDITLDTEHRRDGSRAQDIIWLNCTARRA